MNKIFIVDGMSIVFRAYHALAQSNFRSPDGKPTGAIYGFLNIITNFLEKEDPKYFAVAFDTAAPTFRHEKYDFYKANRAEFPEDLVPQLPIIKQILHLIGVPQIELSGFEADDIIGTISKKTANSENHFYLLTSDKDFYQLIDENISVMKPAGFKTDDFEIVSFSGVIDKFGVSPNQVIEVLALTGDAVDNIPGVKGIGEKTAIPLIQQWGNLEHLYENIDKIDKLSLKKKLIEGKDTAFISRELATIDTNIDLDIGLEELKRKKVEFLELDKLLKQLGFTKIRQRWTNKQQVSNEIDASDNKKEIEQNNSYINYQLIDVNTLEKMNYDKLIDILKNVPYLCYLVDTNSNKIYVLLHKFIYIINLYTKSQNDSKEYNLFTTDLESQNLISDRAKTILQIVLLNEKIEKVGYDFKNQLKYFSQFNQEIKLPLFDIMLASYILNPDYNHSFTGIIQRFEPDLFEIIEKNEKFQNDEFFKFALIALHNIYILQKNKLEKQNQLDLSRKIEFPLLRVLNEMEQNGVKIDRKSLNEISIELENSIRILKTSIHQYAGEEFNIESPKQLAAILFEKLKLPIIKKTKTGPSTDISVLMDLEEKHPIIEKIIEFRQLIKLKNTYVDALPKLINTQTGKIHTTYQQTVAATGRLSSVEPNLQNIPIRSEQGREIRKAFISSFDKGKILSADYSQIELRIMAYYSQDSNLIDAFQNNLDIHSATASKLFSIDIDKVDSNYRRIAKTVNFGIMYGLGSFGLSQRLKIPRIQAQKIIQNYFDKYPGIKHYIDSTIKKTEEQGYVETIMKRRRYFPDIKSNNKNIKSAAERAAINFPIQGSAADMIKMAMIEISNDFANRMFRSKIILQVHDEIVVDLYPEESEEVKKVIVERMENTFILGKIPILAEVGIGDNWFEAH